jgi:hypothetical protein
VGTWTCAHTVGNDSGTYRTTYAKTLGNLWLRQTYKFPPKQFGSNAPAVDAEFLIGYDETRQGWVRFGAISTGQYFAIRMTDTDNGRVIVQVCNFLQASDAGDGGERRDVYQEIELGICRRRAEL